MLLKILRVCGFTALAMFCVGFAALFLVQCLSAAAGLPMSGDGMAPSVVVASALGLMAGAFVCVYAAVEAFA